LLSSLQKLLLSVLHHFGRLCKNSRAAFFRSGGFAISLSRPNVVRDKPVTLFLDESYIDLKVIFQDIVFDDDASSTLTPPTSCPDEPLVMIGSYKPYSTVNGNLNGYVGEDTTTSWGFVYFF
jgi:hypothetical protein